MCTVLWEHKRRNDGFCMGDLMRASTREEAAEMAPERSEQTSGQADKDQGRRGVGGGGEKHHQQ